MDKIKRNIRSVKESLTQSIQNSGIVHKGKEIIENNKDNKKLLIVLGIIAIICIIVFGYILYKYYIANVERVQFFKSIQPTNVAKIIPKYELFKTTMGKEYSFSMWFRINNWYASQSQHKRNIFTFGNTDDNMGVPSVSLASDINDIIIKVKTTNGTDEIILKTIPVKQWFKLTIVMKAKSIQVYLNSKLDIYKLLSGTILLPTHGIYLFKNNNNNQIDGHFSNFVFYNKSLSPSEVSQLYDIGDKPTKQTILYKIINMFLNIGNYSYDKILKGNKCKT